MFSPDRPVYIVGGGPSLREFDITRLRGEQVIAINRSILEVPWAQVGLFLDRRVWNWYRKGFEKFPGRIIWGRNDPRHILPDPLPNLEIWSAHGDTVLETAFPTSIAHGKSSGYAAINVALNLGAKNLILLGYDYRKIGSAGHWHEEHPVWTPPTAFPLMLAGFPALAKKLKDLGVGVWNASPGSALREFPMADLQALPVAALPPPLAAPPPRPVGVYSLVRQSPPWPGAALAQAVPGVVPGTPALLRQRAGGAEARRAVVTWTARGEAAAAARVYGGPWIVMENGAFSHWRPGDISFSIGAHNTLQALPPGNGERWVPPHWPHIKVRPKDPNAPILVIGQMGGTDPEFTHPVRWPVDVVTRIKQICRRPVHFRPKPKYSSAVMPPADVILDPKEPVEDQIDRAYAVVVWTSSVATVALARGTPVVYEGPSIWASEATAGKSLTVLNNLCRPDPKLIRFVMQRMSWASWRREEIAEAWNWLWEAGSAELFSPSRPLPPGVKPSPEQPCQVPVTAGLRRLSSERLELRLPPTR